MALRHGNLTITATDTAEQLDSTKRPLEWIRIDNPTGNTAILVGASGLTTTDYGTTVAAGATLTLGPFIGSPLNLDEIYISGAQDDVVYWLAVTH